MGELHLSQKSIRAHRFDEPDPGGTELGVGAWRGDFFDRVTAKFSFSGFLYGRRGSHTRNPGLGVLRPTVVKSVGSTTLMSASYPITVRNPKRNVSRSWYNQVHTADFKWMS
jgi:hypothetical protein